MTAIAAEARPMPATRFPALSANPHGAPRRTPETTTTTPAARKPIRLMGRKCT